MPENDDGENAVTEENTANVIYINNVQNVIVGDHGKIDAKSIPDDQNNVENPPDGGGTEHEFANEEGPVQADGSTEDGEGSNAGDPAGCQHNELANQMPEEPAMRPRTTCVNSNMRPGGLQRRFSPRPLRGVIHGFQDNDFDWSTDRVLRCPEEALQELATSSNDHRHKLRQLILQCTLPYVEEKLQSGINTRDVYIYQSLITFSCCTEENIKRHALYLILGIVSRDKQEFTNALVSAEKTLRESILREQSVFDSELPSDQGLRLTVYSRVLGLIVVKLAMGELSTGSVGDDERRQIGRLNTKLSELLKSRHEYKRKSELRYAIEFISGAVRRLVESKKAFSQPFAEALERINKNEELNDKITEKIISSWFDLHVVVFAVQAQVYKKPAMISVLKNLVLKYVDAGNRHQWLRGSKIDWRNGHALGKALHDIAVSNRDQCTRNIAGICLILFLKKSKDTTKCNEVRAEITKQCNRIMLGTDEANRRVVLSHLHGNAINWDEFLPGTSAIEYLLWRYRTFTLPEGRSNRYEMLGSDDLRAVATTTFRGERVVIKMARIKPGNILQQAADGQSASYQRLLNEVYVMRRLNSISEHPNILRMLAFDTSQIPYHVITELMPKGCLLNLLQDSRSRSDMVQMLGLTVLVQMCLDVLKALMFVHDQGLVHRSVSAANVLVGEDYVCMLSGFSTTRQMNSPAAGEDTGVPRTAEFVGTDDLVSVRYSSPESLSERRYSVESDVWSFGGPMMYEVFSYGVLPYSRTVDNKDLSSDEDVKEYVLEGGKLPNEDCFHERIYSLMQRCSEFDRNNRPTLQDIKKELEDIQHQLGSSGDDRPPSSPPPLRRTTRVFRNPSPCCTPGDELGSEGPQFPGTFGCHTQSRDRPMLSGWHGSPAIKELVDISKDQVIQKLITLEHENIAKLLSANTSGKDIELITEYCEGGNLLQYVLAKECAKEDLVTYLAQIAKGMCYLHEQDVIHCSLKAENIIMCSPLQVKICRLGRCELLTVPMYAKTSASEYVVKTMPADDLRRSPPEVIKDGLYTHASDLYQFGMLAFEMYTAYDAPKDTSVDEVGPYSQLTDDKVLGFLEGGNRPSKHLSMPQWLYIAVKQCLLHYPRERPPFFLLLDALTSRKPFDSWLLTHWKKQHPEVTSKEVDFKVCQPETATHVIPQEHHLTYRQMRQMIAESVFLPHTYTYVPSYEKDEVMYEDLPDLSEEMYIDVGNDIQESARATSQEQTPCYVPPNVPPRRIARPPTQLEYDDDIYECCAYEEPHQNTKQPAEARSQEQTHPFVPSKVTPRHQQAIGNSSRIADGDIYDDVESYEDTYQQIQDDCDDALYEEISSSSGAAGEALHAFIPSPPPDRSAKSNREYHNIGRDSGKGSHPSLFSSPSTSPQLPQHHVSCDQEYNCYESARYTHYNDQLRGAPQVQECNCHARGHSRFHERNDSVPALDQSYKEGSLQERFSANPSQITCPWSAQPRQGRVHAGHRGRHTSEYWADNPANAMFPHPMPHYSVSGQNPDPCQCHANVRWPLGSYCWQSHGQAGGQYPFHLDEMDAIFRHRVHSAPLSERPKAEVPQPSAPLLPPYDGYFPDPNEAGGQHQAAVYSRLSWPQASAPSLSLCSSIDSGHFPLHDAPTSNYYLQQQDSLYVQPNEHDNEVYVNTSPHDEPHDHQPLLDTPPRIMQDRHRQEHESQRQNRSGSRRPAIIPRQRKNPNDR